ncbi:MAG: tetratricopeptide repeat protein [Candidatus Eisenbacteria bacterium]|nr:tetratricopeptide repeat protein [Candidatus Eisenbacteria bacterium]
MPPRRRVRRRTVLLGLYVFALILRLAYLWDARDNPFPDALGLDARYYDLRAEEILREGLIGDDAYFMGPLYPHLLAAVYGLAGRNLLLVRILQAFAGAAVPVLLYRIGSRFMSPTVALVAAAAAALHAPFIFYTSSILDTALSVVLLLWILDRLSVSAARASFRHPLLTGVLFGLAAAGRGNVLLFLPFALFALARAEPGKRREFRAPFALLLGVLVVIGATTARNYAASGDFVPLTSNGGLNFYIGNGPESSGAYEKPKGLDVDEDPSGRRLLERQLGRPLSPSEVSAEWFSRATAWIRENPGAELRLLLKKTILFFSTFEIPQIETYRFQMRYSPIIRVLHAPFGVFAPLALAGLFLARGRNLFLPVSFVFSYAASIVLFFVLTRYRLPVVPMLLLFAAATLVAFVEEAAKGCRGALLRRFLWIVPFFALCNVNFYRLSASIGEAQSYYRLGIIHQSRGEAEQAVLAYRRSIELDPDYERSRLNLGELLAVTDRKEEAEALFREAMRIEPEYPKASLNLGTLLYRSGRTEEGKAFLEEALRLDPGYGKAWLHLSALALLEGDPDGAEKAFAALASLAPDDPIRGLAEEFLTRIEEFDRIAVWREANSLPRALPPATREAATAELFRDRADCLALYRAGAAGGDPSALYALGAALYREEDWAGASAAFEQAARSAEGHPFLGFARGLVRFREGRPEEALPLFVEETEANPDFLPAWRNAAILASRLGLHGEARRLAGEYAARAEEEDEAIRSILSASPPSAQGTR